MKKKEFAGLKDKTAEALRKMVFEKKAESAKEKINALSGKDKNLKVFRNARREIAQILTLIKEKEIVEKIEKKEVGKI